MNLCPICSKAKRTESFFTDQGQQLCWFCLMWAVDIYRAMLVRWAEGLV
jgi:hypothetical protein